MHMLHNSAQSIIITVVAAKAAASVLSSFCFSCPSRPGISENKCLDLFVFFAQVQALQQAVMKIGEHLSGQQQQSGGDHPQGEQKQGSEDDADVKGDKRDEQK